MGNEGAACRILNAQVLPGNIIGTALSQNKSFLLEGAVEDIDNKTSSTTE